MMELNTDNSHMWDIYEWLKEKPNVRMVCSPVGQVAYQDGITMYSASYVTCIRRFNGLSLVSDLQKYLDENKDELVVFHLTGGELYQERNTHDPYSFMEVKQFEFRVGVAHLQKTESIEIQTGYSYEEIADLKAYGFDVEGMLSNQASEEMAKGIDKEIIEGIKNLYEKNDYMYLLIG